MALEIGEDVASKLGFTCMVGGVLQVAVPFGFIAAVLSGHAWFDLVTLKWYSAATIVWMLLLAAGTAGLYYRHQDAFGWLGQIGSAAIFLGFLYSIIESIEVIVNGARFSSAVIDSVFPEQVILGALLLGISIARAGELQHAQIAGLLLALARPGSFALSMLILEFFNSFVGFVLTVAAVTIPFGTAWLILGYDLVTERDRVGPTAG